PLDVSFMAPLSAYYEQKIIKWLVAHPGRAVTIYQIGKLFTAAFTTAAVMKAAIAGFKERECTRLIAIIEKEGQEKKARKQRLFNPTQDKKGSKAKKGKKEETANEIITNKEEKKVMQDSSSDEEDHEACMFCKELYSQARAKKEWIQACSNADEEDDTLVCDFCS
ncbi:hypothetical protein ILUMI_17944, partial [Ignelater luminosus]